MPHSADSAWPSVSVVMPVRNEERDLRDAVESILAQDYPRPFDVCLAIAPSTDRTAEVARLLAEAHPSVKLVDNPRSVTPAGLNAAIRATGGDIVVRVDGHAELAPGYIRRAVETLQRSGAVNVGGVQRAEGRTPFQRAVAVAMTSRLGVGGGRFHLGGDEGPVDTVYLGVFDRRALEAVGLFDEDLHNNQDYELNIRLRAAGGVVWFDPALWATYRPRSTVRTLARQYFRYGAYKRRVLRRHPGSVRIRQVLPPLATIGVFGGLLLAPFAPLAAVMPGLYALGVLAGSIAAAPRAPGTAARLVVVYPTMHLSWGCGFLVGRAGR